MPQQVGKEFVAKDMAPTKWAMLKRLFAEWLNEEEGEPEHKGQDESAAARERHEGRLSERQREDIGRVDSPRREEMPDDVFLLSTEKKYPVKDKGDDGKWAYSRRLLLAAAREARMHGHEDLAKRADEIRAREFAQANDMAVDRESARSYDAEGRLHVERSNISKAIVNPYFGREIPNSDKLGLDPNRKYRLLRHPDELKKAVETFNNLPILSRHVSATAENHPADLVIGSTGTDAKFEAPYLTNSLVFWPKKAIDDIEGEARKELSCAYRYDADMTPGSHEGEPYDGVMRNIVGNHVALVKEGRAGPDVVVGDSKGADSASLETNGSIPMARNTEDAEPLAEVKEKIAKFLDGKVSREDIDKIHEMIGENYAEDEDRDDDWDEDEGQDARRTRRARDARARLGRDETDEEREEREKQEEARDRRARDRRAARDARRAADAKKRLGRDETEEERRKREEEERAEDRRARDARRKARDAKRAKDDEPGRPEGGLAVTKEAMDAAISAAARDAEQRTIDRLQAVHEAQNFVRPWIGETVLAHDSAEGVYRNALDMLRVKHAHIREPAALRTILEMCPKPGSRRDTSRLAMDSAGVKSFATRHPNAARITVL